ncbi:MAG: c-type cytochrome [Planctomycetes bacterium]|nr:c-type cytochrome [Planctomycetota bacterium]
MSRSLSLFILFFFTSISQAQDRPLPPAEAPKRMTLPEGFHATLFAGEPDVLQPIAMTFDDRGRLWVVECLSSPKWTDKPEGSDRVLMFEDTDGDGKFDKRHVIFDKGANLTSIELGFGGIWLCSIPNLLFIPCDFNADVPKLGKAEVVLDGWSLKCSHNVVNGLIWGPDGWLYGLNGIIATSRVGKPGTPEKDRIAMNCGVWRYHPTRKVFETFASGTTNPFGIDFDEFGECFITNCVIGHLWHVIQGAHFERMYGQDLTPNTYALMPQCADHIHWGGGSWTTSRGGKGIHSEAGGGHAHVGCMVYLGDNFPDKYRNGAFMLNLHGSRINHDRLERQGSGYVAKHEPDFMLANDPWFRGIAIRYGPDGGVYASDWTDTGECHNHVEVDRTNGRIYKYTFGKPKKWEGDLSKLSDAELVKLQTHKNEWQVRHARRLLQERAAAGKFDKDAVVELRKQLGDDGLTLKLRALWTLYSMGEMNASNLASLIEHSQQEQVRAWAIRMSVDADKIDEFMLELLAVVAEKDSSMVVQMAIASALQRVRVEKRSPILYRLARRAEIIGPNLSLMLWYAALPLVEVLPNEAMQVFATARVPLLRRYMARRLVEISDRSPDLWPKLISVLTAKSDDAILDILQGIEDGLLGRKQVTTPKNWEKAYATLQKSKLADVRKSAMRLAVVFGDEKAVESLKKLVADQTASTANRYDALQALLVQQNPAMIPILNDLLADADMRGSAIRGLAAFKNDDTPKQLLGIYPKLSDSEKADVVQTLAARPAWALALLDAVESKQIQRADVSMFVARQMQGLKDKNVQERLAKVWGQIKPASAEKTAQLAKFKKMLTPDLLKTADLSKGRMVFAKNCASCHRLYDDGGNIGPALTGAQRYNLDYVLENMLDPSAIVSRDYQVSKIETTSGRTINGIIKQETEKALTIQTPNEVIVLPKDEIESRTQSPLSIMPEGVLEKLTANEIRDLVAYLGSKDQVPLPK